MDLSRRNFLKSASVLAAGTCFLPQIIAAPPSKPFFEISLAEWSLHRTFSEGRLTNLDFPEIARKEFDIGIVEYVSQFFKGNGSNKNYLSQLNQRAKDNGVKNNLIMVGGEGSLGEPDSGVRKKTVENHYKWIETAKILGCKTIRVNAFGKGSKDKVAQALAEGLLSLGKFALKENINVVVENHGGYSSDASWLAEVVKNVNLKNVGTLPDFGNFCIKKDSTGSCIESYDRRKGIEELMPYAKGVSAKSYDFSLDGEETQINYLEMMKIVKETGFMGIVGIEYEGNRLSEYDGIKATKKLLEKSASMI